MLLEARRLVQSLVDDSRQTALFLTALDRLRAKGQSRGDGVYRLRSVHLPVLVFQCLGHRPERALPLAAAMTLLFIGIDVLDDLHDGDRPLYWRRRGPEVHLAAETLVSGIPFAIVARLQVSPAKRLSLVKTLAEGLLRMSAGQHRDLRLSGPAANSVKRVLSSVDGKSGSLLATFCGLAADLGGAGSRSAAAFTSMGRFLGIASQLRSDCFEVLDRPRIGGRLVSTTMPLVLHARTLKGASRKTFADLVEARRVSPAARGEVQRSLLASGALAATAALVNLNGSMARRALVESGAAGAPAAELHSMIDETMFL